MESENSDNDDQNVLKHLLDLEAEAAALVNEAEAEAERRVAEGEKACRARFDEIYSAEAAKLEKIFNDEVASLKEDYKKQLDAYRNSLKEAPINTKAFSSLAEHLLFREAASNISEDM